ncbi:MAG: hypothetical protein ACRD5K_06925 [Candidatus Acidiferrales bacterium]
MNRSISRILVAAALTTLVNAPVSAGAHTGWIVVESPSELPKAARGRSEAMLLHQTRQGEMILYLEQDQGKKLAVLDVTDPADIRAVGQVSLDAPSPYDFVQNLGDSAALIQFRNHSGFAVIGLKKYREPVLKPKQDYLHPASVESYEPNGLLLVSSDSPSAPVQRTQYEVLSISNPASPTPLATIKGVIQRVDMQETGTMFLLGDEGLTVIRNVAAEQEYQMYLDARN